MSESDQEGLDRTQLDAWGVAELPSDFEDRVIAAMARSPAEPEDVRSIGRPESRPADGRRRVMLAVAPALATAAAVATLWAWQDSRPSSVPSVAERSTPPHPRPAQMEQHDRGHRSWTVEAGSRLEVHTPVATARIDGPATFEMEIEPMEQSTRRALFTAAGLATATVVGGFLLVHEGSVSLANAHGEVTVQAEHSAVAVADRAPVLAPSIAPPPSKAPTVAKKRYDDLKARIAAQARTREAEPEPAPEPESEGTPPAAKPSPWPEDQLRMDLLGEVGSLMFACFKPAMEDGKFAGKVVFKLQFTGEPEVGGIIEQVEILETSDTILDRPEFHECVQESIWLVELPPPEHAGSVTVTYPVRFSEKDEVPPGGFPDDPTEPDTQSAEAHETHG